jgi:hypothetical protein
MYPIADHQALELSTSFNLTLCTNATFSNTCVFNDSVFNDRVSFTGPSAVEEAGNHVNANESAAFQVLTFGSTGSDLTAVIVPAASVIPSGMSFQSTSYGMGATCEPAL